MIYGYLRVSTDDQDSANQKLGVCKKAESLGLSVDNWIIDDGISGTKEPEKRLLGKLMKKLQKGDVIITSELSRLGRKLFMIMRILEFCMLHEVKVYTVKDGYELGDNIQSKVLAFAFGIAAEIERDMISQRTKEALARKKGTKDGLLITEAHDFSGNMVSANWGNMTTNYTPASQISKIMWEYYAYTQDRDYLRNTIYPFMKEAAEFYLNFLQWDDVRKEFYIYPAQPYEHEWSSKLKNTITDRYMIESLFKNCIKAAQDLNMDKSKIKQWKHVISHLWAPPILDVPEKGKVFGLAFTENNEVYPDAKTNIQGYHFDAHTTAVFPAGVLGLDHKGTDYFEIARNIALHHPKNRNAITPGAIVSARLGLGDKVLERLQCSVNYLQHFNQGLFYNLDHWHYFSRYVDQIPNAELYAQRDYMYDSRLTYNRPEAGKSGFRTKPFVQCGMETMGLLGTAINEMLLQSHEGKIRVFPAIPSKFASAFTLRAEGAFIVSSVIDSLGNIPFVEIKSLAGKECRIQNPWDDDLVQVVTQNNRNVNIEVNKDNVISFKTTIGESYIVRKKGIDVNHVSKTYHAVPNMFPKKYGEAMLGKECTFIDREH